VCEQQVEAVSIKHAFQLCTADNKILSYTVHKLVERKCYWFWIGLNLVVLLLWTISAAD